MEARALSKYSFEDYCSFANHNTWLWQVDLITGRRLQSVSENDIHIAECLLDIKFNSIVANLIKMFGFIPIPTHDSNFLNLPPDFDCVHTNMFYDEQSETNKKRDTDENTTLYNIVTSTIWLRNETDLPKSFIAIWDDDGDEYGCIDMSSKEATIVVWDYFNRSIARIENRSIIDFLFFEYLIECCRYVNSPNKKYSFKTNRSYNFIWPKLLLERITEDLSIINGIYSSYRNINPAMLEFI